MLRLPNDLVVAQEQLTRCKHRPRFPLSPEGDSPQREKFYGSTLGLPLTGVRPPPRGERHGNPGRIPVNTGSLAMGDSGCPDSPQRPLQPS